MPFKHITIRQRKSTKKKYRVRNWPEYNRALVSRGEIVFMLAEDITEKWHETPLKRLPGGQKYYTDFAIEFCLQVRLLLNS